MFFIDPLYLVMMAPVLILTFYAQFKVKSAFRKYSQIAPHSGLTGGQASRQLLDKNNLQDVAIDQVEGNLSDNYDPRARILHLSPDVYNGRSLAAVGVAAHEAGHAMQDARGYWPMKVRAGLVPAANFGSQGGFYLFFIGLLITAWFRSPVGYLVMNIGIIAFAIAVLFQIVTLPVEFNASRRAMAQLAESGIISDDEYHPTRKVLSAAALTYVAAAASAVVTLLYLILRGREE
jgi:uncharacterized protein